MNRFFFLAVSLLPILGLQAQNCGQIIDFTGTITNNGNGTSTYNFYFAIQATSGGSKSVLFTIACPGHNFIVNQCEASQATVRNMHYGPFTIPTCTGPAELTWSGHSNAACGGTTCSVEQTFSMSSLPVELSAFNSEIEHGKVVLHWKTEQEHNNDKFFVERSTDAKNFLPIGEIKGKGTVTGPSAYRFEDEHPAPGTNYYQLRQMDFDGKWELSPMISVHIGREAKPLVYPTYFTGELKVEMPENSPTETVVFSVYNLQGALVVSHSLVGGPHFAFPLSDLPDGPYIAEIRHGHGVTRTRVFKG